MPSSDQSLKCQHHWICNGAYRSQKRGHVQRYRCTSCRATRKRFERMFSPDMVQALGLLALRLTLDQAKALTGLKSTTIRRALLEAQKDPKRWEALGASLAGLGIDHDAVHMLGEVAWGTSLTHRCSPGYHSGETLDRAEHKRAIERVLGTEVIIGRSRQGIWVIRRRELEDLIHGIRKFPFDRVKAEVKLSPQELRGLTQLHTPNRNMQLLSKIFATEIEVDLRGGQPEPARVNLKSMADFLNMDEESLHVIVIALVRKFRKRLVALARKR